MKLLSPSMSVGAKFEGTSSTAQHESITIEEGCLREVFEKKCLKVKKAHITVQIPRALALFTAKINPLVGIYS